MFFEISVTKTVYFHENLGFNVLANGARYRYYIQSKVSRISTEVTIE